MAKKLIKKLMASYQLAIDSASIKILDISIEQKLDIPIIPEMIKALENAKQELIKASEETFKEILKEK